jgi:hypothetical protein
MTAATPLAPSDTSGPLCLSGEGQRLQNPVTAWSMGVPVADARRYSEAWHDRGSRPWRDTLGSVKVGTSWTAALSAFSRVAAGISMLR